MVHFGDKLNTQLRLDLAKPQIVTHSMKDKKGAQLLFLIRLVIPERLRLGCICVLYGRLRACC
jgi:hypothetical protein